MKKKKNATYFGKLLFFKLHKIFSIKQIQKILKEFPYEENKISREGVGVLL